MPHGTRLYSIAATRYGDSFDGNTVSALALLLHADLRHALGAEPEPWGAAN